MFKRHDSGLNFYDSMRELREDVKKLEEEGYIVLSINRHNLSVKYVKDNSETE